MNEQYYLPQWAFEFHGHTCPFMPISYRMCKLALEYLKADREMDHGFHVFTELGEGHLADLHDQWCTGRNRRDLWQSTHVETFLRQADRNVLSSIKGRGVTRAQARFSRRNGKIQVFYLP